MRWLYHVLPAGELAADPYLPASFARDGFVHTSFAPELGASIRLHFAGAPLGSLRVLKIDPRRLPAPVVLASTPRGPMPHVHGPLPRDAVRAELSAADVPGAGVNTAAPPLEDRVAGTRVGLVAFDGMTLLDLVGVHDPLARIASMGFDPTTTTEVFGAASARVWVKDGAALTVDRVRPPLDDLDLLVVPGGPGARALEDDAEGLTWLRTFPENRLHASVCTGALVLGAEGCLRGLRATTHASALDRLPAYGATPAPGRVVDEGQRVTAGGVTAGLDLGLHLVERLMGPEVARRIAQQMEWPRPGTSPDGHSPE